MLVTPQTNRKNQRLALTVAIVAAIAFAVLGWFNSWIWLGLLLGPLAYWFLRRECKRRLRWGPARLRVESLPGGRIVPG